MTTYDTYKDSGIAWLGQIPSHWEVTSLRRFLKPFTLKGFPENQLLSVTREQGVIIRDMSRETNHNVIPEDLSGYKVVKKGQFVINKMKSWQGSYGVSNYDGIVSPAYFVYDLDIANKEFFSFALRSKAYIPFFMQYSKGIRVDQWDLSPFALKAIPFMLPSPAEQEAIVNYLKNATAKIDEAIAQQQKMIDLLKERKQIIINEAITHGLDPNVPMKQTGIDWLPQIPAHWELKQLRFVVEFLDHLRAPITADQRERTNPQYDYYGASGVIDRIDHYNVDDKVLLIGEDGANLLLRNLPLIYRAEGKFWVNNHAHIIKPKVDDYDYVAFMLEAGDYTLYITGSAQPKLTQLNLKSFIVPVPPISEQKLIVSKINQQINPINETIFRCERMIELLTERKQIIINDVVTGKIKVS